MYRQEAFGGQQRRGGAKKSVQQGRSHFCARSVLVLRERSRPEEGQACEPEGPEKWRERRWRLFSTDPQRKMAQ